ncbi:hypothetical protein KAZ57_03410 [Patescibacteria group bacterium]|nr:hypothetical protein [Patescibacteria group bacterium]
MNDLSMTLFDGKWLPINMRADLQKKGGLKRVDTWRENEEPNTCSGTYGTVSFATCWQPGVVFSLSMTRYSAKLVDAFSVILGSTPFCKFKHEKHGHVVKWVASGHEHLFDVWTSEVGVSNVQRLMFIEND